MHISIETGHCVFVPVDDDDRVLIETFVQKGVGARFLYCGRGRFRFENDETGAIVLRAAEAAQAALLQLRKDCYYGVGGLMVLDATNAQVRLTGGFCSGCGKPILGWKDCKHRMCENCRAGCLHEFHHHGICIVANLRLVTVRSCRFCGAIAA